MDPGPDRTGRDAARTTTLRAGCLGRADMPRWAARLGLLPVPLRPDGGDAWVVVESRRGGFVLDLGEGGDGPSVAWSCDVAWHLAVDGFWTSLRRCDGVGGGARIRTALLWERAFPDALSGRPSAAARTVGGVSAAADAALRPYMPDGAARYRLAVALLLGAAGYDPAAHGLRDPLVDAFRLPDDVFRGISADLGAAGFESRAVSAREIGALALEAFVRPGADAAGGGGPRGLP